MRKTLMALAASSVIGVSAIAAPTPANAHAWWVVPAIVGGALVTGAVIANPAYAWGPGPYYGPAPYYGPGPYYGPAPAYYGGTVAVRPNCRVVRERSRDGWRRVRICR